MNFSIALLRLNDHKPILQNLRNMGFVVELHLVVGMVGRELWEGSPESSS